MENYIITTFPVNCHYQSPMKVSTHERQHAANLLRHFNSFQGAEAGFTWSHLGGFAPLELGNKAGLLHRHLTHDNQSSKAAAKVKVLDTVRSMKKLRLAHLAGTPTKHSAETRRLSVSRDTTRNNMIQQK